MTNFSMPMKRSFFEWLLPENSNHKGRERGAPISQRHWSMHRHGRAIRQAIRLIAHQALKHAQHLRIARCLEGRVRHCHGQPEKVFVVHMPIIGRWRACGHSYFPMGFIAKNFAPIGTGNYRKFS